MPGFIVGGPNSYSFVSLGLKSVLYPKKKHSIYHLYDLFLKKPKGSQSHFPFQRWYALHLLQSLLNTARSGIYVKSGFQFVLCKCQIVDCFCACSSATFIYRMLCSALLCVCNVYKFISLLRVPICIDQCIRLLLHSHCTGQQSIGRCGYAR